MKPSIKKYTTVLIPIAALALGSAPLIASEDCPPVDPPTSEPSESAASLEPLDLPVRPAPKLKRVQPKSTPLPAATAPAKPAPAKSPAPRPAPGKQPKTR